MKVITITLNPAIDKSVKVDGVFPEQKLRCHSVSYQAGGGGINVSRILKRLNQSSKCFFTSGGDNGKLLEHLLSKEDIEIYPIKSSESTRENLSVFDTLTHKQFRFGMPGGSLSNQEFNNFLIALDSYLEKDDFVVLSGSLSPSMPTILYDEIISVVQKNNGKVAVDTSGTTLKHIISQPIFMIKPNQKELAMLSGNEFLSTIEQENFVTRLIETTSLQLICVSLGARGALLASEEGIIYQSTPSVPVLSTVGAGDSTLAGLIYGIINNFSLEKTLRYGVACGTATTMSEGTNLASSETIQHTLNLLR